MGMWIFLGGCIVGAVVGVVVMAICVAGRFDEGFEAGDAARERPAGRCGEIAAGARIETGPGCDPTAAKVRRPAG
ncbi:hypothetical protein [Stenotrophomonas sp. MMGLT7]|uniref:hypothetical protein n=1 Tax=Stenotrophomonas sp. MMGLT7 TaxID=2901227 RepID=UPI001E59CE7D|nr:hypothetical protein [Stenotrophomonas sp. MMGLT7]MCD7098626.1 hypothetical protein [Stenotrophomonas sp. MMGLT7]